MKEHLKREWRVIGLLAHPTHGKVATLSDNSGCRLLAPANTKEEHAFANEACELLNEAEAARKRANRQT